MYTDLKNLLDGLMERQLEENTFVGASLYILKNGKQIYRNNFGMADKARAVPVRDDTIFRLYSMTKPITAAAAMILYDRGRLHLDDPVSWFIKGFDEPKVYHGDKLVPAKRQIKIRDLFTMTSGLVYPDAGTPAGDAMSELFDGFYKGAYAGKAMSTLEMCEEIGKRPLCCDPGELWNYGTSADVLAGVVEA